MEAQLLTVAEVARRLQQSERTVRDKIASGALPAIRIGTGPRAPIRVDLAELEAWLKRGRSDPHERCAPDNAAPVVERRPPAGQKGAA